MSRVQRNITSTELERISLLSEALALGGPEPIAAVWKGQRIRAVHSQTYCRPTEEEFQEFQLFHLIEQLGRDWFRAQSARLSGERHIIVDWVECARKTRRDSIEALSSGITRFTRTATGKEAELLALAEDVYRLAHSGRLEQRALKKLRHPDQYQGIRYELAVAACFIRGGFQLRWLHEPTQSHVEFVATHPNGDQIAVEAKSRHRKGHLNEQGTQVPNEELRADVTGLLAKALKKETGSTPFAIFIDVNLPTTAGGAGMSSWLEDLDAYFKRRSDGTKDHPAKEFALFLTNYNWHFDPGDSTGGRHLSFFPEWVVHRPLRDETFAGLLASLRGFGKCPELGAAGTPA